MTGKCTSGHELAPGQAFCSMCGAPLAVQLPSHNLRRKVFLIAGGVLMFLGFEGAIAVFTSHDPLQRSTSAGLGATVFLVIGTMLMVLGLKTKRSVNHQERGSERIHNRQNRRSERVEKHQEQVLDNKLRGRLREFVHWALMTPAGLIRLVAMVGLVVVMPQDQKLLPVILYSFSAGRVVKSRIQRAQMRDKRLVQCLAAGETELLK